MTEFVLIDYENVQPTEFTRLQGGPFQIKIFVGARQAKIPVPVARALQAFGTNAEYVLLEALGSNALDFHVAYYIGLLSAQDPEARFHIISKDTGFDPLIKHLTANRTVAHRYPSIGDMPLKPSASAALARLQLAIAHLTNLKAAKPRTHKTLLGTLNALNKKELSDVQLSSLVAALCERGVVKIDGTNVSYDLPSGT
jgi:hypothetical protein